MSVRRESVYKIVLRLFHLYYSGRCLIYFLPTCNPYMVRVNFILTGYKQTYTKPHLNR